jgi:ABC-type branched-subunit amino acid transport system substrate-binding protein
LHRFEATLPSVFACRAAARFPPPDNLAPFLPYHFRLVVNSFSFLRFSGVNHAASNIIKSFCTLRLYRSHGLSFQVYAADTIKVGIMHSLSGTMAISETPLKDVALMAIDDINAKGGVLGKKLEPVVVDPASNWPLFAEKARQLLTQDKVAVVFGCWTSVSRKSVLPVLKS